MRRQRRHLLAGLLTATLVASGGTVTAQENLEDARAQREEVRRERAAAAIQLDVSRAADAELAAALEDLTAQISAQQASLEDARRRLAAAEDARVAAEARVAEAVQAQEGLWDTLRERAIAGFVGEGLASTSLLLSVEHPTVALRRSTLMAAVQADTGDVLEDLRALEEDRAIAQAQADAAVATAARLEADLARIVQELEEQRQAQAALKAELERRVAGWQAQVRAFSQEERELTAFIQAEVAAEEARRRAAEEEARRRAAEEEARRQAAQEQANAAAQEQARRAANPPPGSAGPEQQSRVANADPSDGGSGSSEAPSSPAASSESGRASSGNATTTTTAPPATTTTTAAPSAPSGSSSSGYQWPVAGRVSSGFGYRVHPIFGTRRLHAGLDVSAGSGTPIYATKGGTVLFAGWRDGYGNTVMILHDGGIVSLYAHQSRIAASNGESVSGGDLIGYVGSTGWSTGPHLHFEIRVDGAAVDPRPYLP